MVVVILGRPCPATTAAIAAIAADLGEDPEVHVVSRHEKETTTYSLDINCMPRAYVVPKDPSYLWERPLKKRLLKNRLPKNRLPLFSKRQNLKRHHGIPRSHSNRTQQSLRD